MPPRAPRRLPHVEVLILEGADADNLRDLSRQAELPGIVVVRLGLAIMRFLSRLESHGWHVAVRTHDGHLLRTYEWKDMRLKQKGPPSRDEGPLPGVE